MRELCFYTKKARLSEGTLVKSITIEKCSYIKASEVPNNIEYVVDSTTDEVT